MTNRCGCSASRIVCHDCKHLLEWESRILDRKQSLDALTHQIEWYERGKSLVVYLEHAMRSFESNQDPNLISKLLLKYRGYLQNAQPILGISEGLVLSGWNLFLEPSTHHFQSMIQQSTTIKFQLLSQVHDELYAMLLKLRDGDQVFQLVAQDVVHSVDMDIASIKSESDWASEKIQRQKDIIQREHQSPREGFYTAIRHSSTTIEELSTLLTTRVDPTRAFPRTWTALQALSEFLKDYQRLGKI